MKYFTETSSFGCSQQNNTGFFQKIKYKKLNSKNLKEVKVVDSRITQKQKEAVVVEAQNQTH